MNNATSDREQLSSSERVALLVDGPLHGYRVRADLLDPRQTGAFTLQYGTDEDDRGVATYWLRDAQPGGHETVWDWKP